MELPSPFLRSFGEERGALLTLMPSENLPIVEKAGIPLLVIGRCAAYHYHLDKSVPYQMHVLFEEALSALIESCIFGQSGGYLRVDLVSLSSYFIFHLLMATIWVQRKELCPILAQSLDGDSPNRRPPPPHTRRA